MTLRSKRIKKEESPLPASQQAYGEVSRDDEEKDLESSEGQQESDSGSSYISFHRDPRCKSHKGVMGERHNCFCKKTRRKRLTKHTARMSTAAFAPKDVMKSSEQSQSNEMEELLHEEYEEEPSGTDSDSETDADANMNNSSSSDQEGSAHAPGKSSLTTKQLSTNEHAIQGRKRKYYHCCLPNS